MTSSFHSGTLELKVGGSSWITQKRSPKEKEKGYKKPLFTSILQVT
jgi:hypothetical protein